MQSPFQGSLKGRFRLSPQQVSALCAQRRRCRAARCPSRLTSWSCQAPMPQGKTPGAPLLSSSFLGCRAKDKAEVELIDLGGNALERVRGCEAGEAGSPRDDLRGQRGWASALNPTGRPRGVRRVSKPHTLDLAGRRIHLHESRFRQLPRSGAPANPRDRKREGAVLVRAEVPPEPSRWSSSKPARKMPPRPWGTGRKTGRIRRAHRGDRDITLLSSRAGPFAHTAGGCKPELPGDSGEPWLSFRWSPLGLWLHRSSSPLPYRDFLLPLPVLSKSPSSHEDTRHWN